MKSTITTVTLDYSAYEKKWRALKAVKDIIVYYDNNCLMHTKKVICVMKNKKLGLPAQRKFQ